MTSKIEWRVVPGREDLEVSSDGRVRASAAASDFRLRGLQQGREYRTQVDKRGYAACRPMKDGIQRTLKVHKMVAAAFIGPRPDGFHINHKNGIKTDNRVENLEYVTPLENTQHAVRCGLNIYGEASVHAKLTEENVRDILARLATESQRSLGKKFGVSTTTIRKIALGQRWKHVTLDPA